MSSQLHDIVKNNHNRDSLSCFDKQYNFTQKTFLMHLGSTTQTQSLELSIIAMVSLFKVGDDEVYPYTTQLRSH